MRNAPISRALLTTWLLFVALEATVSCEKHDKYGNYGRQDYHDNSDDKHNAGRDGHRHHHHQQQHHNIDNSHPYDSDRQHRDYHDEPDRRMHFRDDYHQNPNQNHHHHPGLPENEMFDRKAAYDDSRPLYEHQKVYERRPVFHDPLYYSPPAASHQYHDDHSRYRNQKAHIDDYNRYPAQYKGAHSSAPRSAASILLEKQLNRSLSRGLHHLRDAKHQLSPETRNTIRNLKNELLNEDPRRKGKRLSKRVDSLVKRGSLLAKAL